MRQDNFFEVIKKRRSVRSFSDKTVQKSKAQKILVAARLGPSSGGLQAFEIFLVNDKKRKKLLVDAAAGQQCVNAPLVLVFCTNPRRLKKFGRRGKQLFTIQDATIATTYAQLAASALGLKSVWIGRFKEKQVQKILRTRFRPVTILPIGYSNQKPKPKKLRNLSEMVHRI